jgi:hypothetical protein
MPVPQIAGIATPTSALVKGYSGFDVGSNVLSVR